MIEGIANIWFHACDVWSGEIILRYGFQLDRPVCCQCMPVGCALVKRPQTVQTRRCIVAVSKLDEVVSLAKRRGFVFPAGEIYGGTRSAWD